MPVKIKKGKKGQPPAPVNLRPMPEKLKDTLLEAQDEDKIRIRILRPFTFEGRRMRPGQSLTAARARGRSWIGYGLAEEDKMVEAAPETKGGSVMEGHSGHRAGPTVTLEVKQGGSPYPVPPPGAVPEDPGKK